MVQRVALLLAILLLTPFPAQAQTAPVQVQFVGTITSSASDTLTIRQADGSSAPWTGPLPDYPYVTGDQITISFNAAPTPGFLDPSYPVKPVDGIYRFTVASRQQLSGSELGVALLGGLDASGPISGAVDQFASGMVLTFNSNTNTWGMELPRGTYSLGEFDGPSFSYDPATGGLASTGTTRQPVYGCGELGNGCFLASGDLVSGGFNRIPIWGTDGSLRGIFSVLFSGNWFVNGQQVGGATDVPEPGQLGLFALALLAVMMQRGRRRGALAQGL